ncbi:hypothetical protein Csa_000978, partial [Cucumis sativus]
VDALRSLDRHLRVHRVLYSDSIGAAASAPPPECIPYACPSTSTFIYFPGSASSVSILE